MAATFRPSMSRYMRAVAAPNSPRCLSRRLTMNKMAPVAIMALPARPQRKYSHLSARPPNCTMCSPPITDWASDAPPPSTPPGWRTCSTSPVAAENMAMPLVGLRRRRMLSSPFQP